LGAIQRLALGLFVEAQHDRTLGGIEVEADDVDELVLEVEVVGEPEGLDLPRLEVVVAPDRPSRMNGTKSSSGSLGEWA